jgi:hypothetical protein
MYIHIYTYNTCVAGLLQVHVRHKKLLHRCPAMRTQDPLHEIIQKKNLRKKYKKQNLTNFFTGALQCEHKTACQK